MIKRKDLLILGLFVLGAATVITSMILFVGPLFEKNPSDAGICKHSITPHTVVIQNNQIAPVHTFAKSCDTLTIVNKDSVTRLLAFGQHDNHIEYGGISEKRLEAGQQFSVTLQQTGTFLIHDHYDESVSAEFTVNH